MKQFFYKGSLIWREFPSGYYCALGGLKADTLAGIKRLINKKYAN